MSIGYETGTGAKFARTILEETALKLGKRDEGDLALTGILVQHLLTVQPATGAMEKALAAIRELARVRAAQGKEDADA